MKRLTYLISTSLLLALFLWSAGVQAQTTPAKTATTPATHTEKTPEQKSVDRTKWLEKQIAGLSADQVTKIQAAYLDYYKTMDQIKSSAEKTGKDKEIQTARDTRNNAFKQIMNDEQYKKYMEIYNEEMNHNKSNTAPKNQDSSTPKDK